MSDVQVSSETLQKMAEYVAATSPRLEKYEAEKQAFDARVPVLVDEMIKKGAVSPESRQTAIDQLVNGGVVKAAEVIDSLLENFGPRSMGTAVEKTASAHSSLPKSDQVFLEKLGLA